MQAYHILEQLDEVVSYEYEKVQIPYLLNGEMYTYVPDVLVTYKSGKQQLIEVKPQWILDDLDEKDVAKLEAGKKYASENEMIFSLWTEDDLNV